MLDEQDDDLITNSKCRLRLPKRAKPVPFDYSAEVHNQAKVWASQGNTREQIHYKSCITKSKSLKNYMRVKFFKEARDQEI